MKPGALLSMLVGGLLATALQAHACGSLRALPSPPADALRVTDFGALPA